MDIPPDSASNAKYRHLVRQELLPGLDIYPTIELKPEHVLARRAQSNATVFGWAEAPLPDGLARSERFIPGPEGAPDVRVLIYSPAGRSTPRPALLHIHGGGYLFGVPEINDVANRRIALALDCVIVSVDYRLPPEATYPGPLEDCYAALSWLFGQAESLGVDPKRIGVAGESAGGGLAAALCLLARDRGEIPICFQALTAPMIDDRTGSSIDAPPHTGEFVWTPGLNRLGWSFMLGKDPGGGDVSPYAAAARAENVSGLPPTFLYVGALDLFVLENIDYARRLVAAGVPTELHVYPGAYHGFEIAPGAELVEIAMRDWETAVRRAFARPHATEAALL